MGPEVPRDPPDEELRAKLDEVIAGIKAYEEKEKAKLRDIEFLEWAKKGGIRHLVLGHYPLTSTALHHGPRDLERRFQIAGDQLEGLILGCEQGEVGDLLLVATKLVFASFQRYAHSLDVEVPIEIHKLYEQNDELQNKRATKGAA
jgi:hypothetical protein